MKPAILFYAILVLALSGLPALVACNKQDIDGKTVACRAYNLRYGRYERNRLDVYLPARRTHATPFLVFIHGGSWIAGDKSDYNGLQDNLMQRGIASVSINYRYADTGVHYPQLMEDIAAAVRFCHSKSEDWRTRKDNFVMGGVSAGGHMALLYSYRYDTMQRIKAVISAAGPVDITQRAWLDSSVVNGLIFGLEQMVGAAYIPDAPLDPRFKEVSPRLYLRNIPTLMIHGTKDLLVPFVQSQLLATDLKNAGIPCRLVILPGERHNLGLANPVSWNMFLTELETWCKVYGR